MRLMWQEIFLVSIEVNEMRIKGKEEELFIYFENLCSIKEKVGFSSLAGIFKMTRLNLSGEKNK